MEDLSILIKQAQNGDKDSFGAIYSLFLKRIFRFIYYLVYNYEIAQDLAQETFIKAWRSLPSFSENKGSLQAFLFTIARNLAIDHQRKKKTVSLEAVGELSYDQNMESAMIQKDSQQTVWDALSALDGFERDIIILRYFEEISHAEIAKVVGKREGAVRVRIHRALRKLEKHIKEKHGY